MGNFEIKLTRISNDLRFNTAVKVKTSKRSECCSHTPIYDLKVRLMDRKYSTDKFQRFLTRICNVRFNTAVKVKASKHSECCSHTPMYDLKVPLMDRKYNTDKFQRFLTHI